MPRKPKRDPHAEVRRRLIESEREHLPVLNRYRPLMGLDELADSPIAEALERGDVVYLPPWKLDEVDPSSPGWARVDRDGRVSIVAELPETAERIVDPGGVTTSAAFETAEDDPA